MIFKNIQKAFSPRYLFLTNVVTGTVTMISADLLQQKTTYLYNNRSKDEIKPFEIDKRRLLGMTIGGLAFGVVGHSWYKFLDKRWPGHGLKSIRSKLTAEMAIGPPFLIIWSYLIAVVEAKPASEWMKNLKENFIYLIIADWCCFLPLQAINFYFLPPKYRYLFVAVLTFIYDYFLSFIFHR